MRGWKLFLKSFLLPVSALVILSSCASKYAVQSDHEGLLDRFEGERSGDFSSSEGKIGEGAVRPGNSGSSKNNPAFLGWPLNEMEITSPFGKRRGQFHEGVDLRAKKGTQVYAAQSGEVLYAAQSIRGYGKMVVIRHQNDWATVYAHNSKILVQKGQNVVKGQPIAVSGDSGRSRGAHLHFEVRKGVVAMNPQTILPAHSDRIVIASAAPLAVPAAAATAAAAVAKPRRSASAKKPARSVALASAELVEPKTTPKKSKLSSQQKRPYKARRARKERLANRRYAQAAIAHPANSKLEP